MGLRHPYKILNGHRGIAGIEKTIQHRAADVHASRHIRLPDFALLHRLLNLPGKRPEAHTKSVQLE